MVRARVLGWKWKKGFFSMGFAEIEDTSPYTIVYSLP
jgi:hypothetical protein